MHQTVHLLLVVVDNSARLPDLLQAWRENGIPGATILHSTGMHRFTSWLDRLGLGALEHVFEAGISGQRTLLVAIEGEELLARAIAEAERVLGGFESQNSGLLLALPVAQVRGLHKVRLKPQAEPPPPPPALDVRQDLPVEQVLSLFNLTPTVVAPETPLLEVGRKLLENNNTQLACVVGEDGRLVGLIDVYKLVDDLFFRVMPEAFLSEVTDLDHMLHYARLSGLRTAADAMQEPVWVEKSEQVKTAFQRMHQHQLRGLPVVDQAFQIVGYVNLLALLVGSVQAREEGDAEA